MKSAFLIDQNVIQGNSEFYKWERYGGWTGKRWQDQGPSHFSLRSGITSLETLKGSESLILVAGISRKE